MDDIIGLIIIFLLLPIVGIILGTIAFFRSLGLRRDLAALTRELAALRAAGGPAAAPPQPAPIVEPAPPAVEPTPASAEPPPIEPVAEPAPVEPAPPEEIPAEPPLAAAVSAPAAGRPGLESRLTGRWTVWLGALAVALGGVFLVKAAIDEGLLGPAVRVAMGALLGCALIAAAFWLRRRPAPEADAAPPRPDYVSPALTAAGVSALFATVYAAFALYHFMPALVAFALLAGAAFLGVALSLIFGPFIALLGLAGAYLVPLLIQTGHPTALGLFGYLLVVTIACLALVRYRGWWWLAAVALACSSLWIAAWFGDLYRPRDGWVLGAYIVLQAGLFIEFARQAVWSEGEATVPWRSTRYLIIWAAAALSAFLMLGLTGVGEDARATLVATGALMTLLLATGRRDAALDALSWLAALLAILVVVGWRPLDAASAEPVPGLAPPLIPAVAGSFVATAIAYAVLLGAAFLVQWGAPRPGRWAVTAAAGPFFLLVAAYWRLFDLAPGIPWTVLGLALAALLLAAAWRSAQWRELPGMEGALAAYAVGVIAAISLAATMALQHGWLTVALAVQIPAIAWVAERTRVPVLRRVALALALTVLARLLLNPSILDYPTSHNLVFNWLLYGYGIPCAAFALGVVLFRREADDLLVQVLEAGAVALAAALVSLEIHQLFGNGDLASENYDFAEASVQTDAWLAGALILFSRTRGRRRLVLVWSWRLMAIAATAHLFVWEVLAANPLFTGDEVGETPIFNALLLAYAAPAALAVLFLAEARLQGERIVAMIAGPAAWVLGFLAVSLELRQWFHGTDLTAGPTTDAENYAYSLAWLAYGGALLGLGLWKRQAALRLAGLGVLTLTVGKTFLFDMSNLTGLYRAASFLGLGLSLIAIGYLYQRLALLTPRPAPPPPAPS